MGILEEFDNVTNIVNKDRQAVYGDPEPNFRDIARMRRTVDQCRDPVLREVLGMICTKVARLCKSPNHVDSWIDVAGYARVGAMILDSRDKAVAIPLPYIGILPHEQEEEDEDPSANPERPD